MASSSVKHVVVHVHRTSWPLEPDSPLQFRAIILQFFFQWQIESKGFLYIIYRQKELKTNSYQYSGLYLHCITYWNRQRRDITWFIFNQSWLIKAGFECDLNGQCFQQNGSLSKNVHSFVLLFWPLSLLIVNRFMLLPLQRTSYIYIFSNPWCIPFCRTWLYGFVLKPLSWHLDSCLAFQSEYGKVQCHSEEYHPLINRETDNLCLANNDLSVIILSIFF